jgi:PHP family Zn ribbon phosphoesterase
MKYFYDFHIHSDLSPCADKEMTPNNIVNMAYIKGLNMIAITDHNSIENYKAIENIAKELNIMTIAGMEINTKEEVHILTYFRDYNSAKLVSDLIYESLPEIYNKKEIFGEQNIYNENDEIVGILDKLLINSSKYSLKEVCEIVISHNGVIVPAHVNKKSNGILGVLGFFPVDIDFDFIELSNNTELNDRVKRLTEKYKKIVNSDAHMLENISEPLNYIELDKPEDIFNYLGFR